jgi:hypothetical protein
VPASARCLTLTAAAPEDISRLLESRSGENRRLRRCWQARRKNRNDCASADLLPQLARRVEALAAAVA